MKGYDNSWIVHTIPDINSSSIRKIKIRTGRKYTISENSIKENDIKYKSCTKNSMKDSSLVQK